MRIAFMIITILVVLVVAVFLFMRLPQFGRLPSGKRLDRIKQSPNYKDGNFQNLEFTPQLSEGASYPGVIKEFLFETDKRNTPEYPLPSVKTNLKAISKDEEVLIWFGHSSYFIQTGGKKILVDPVLSGHASPVNFTTKSFKGTDIYSAEDFPEIDYLFISHDHYDHLDYETIVKLKSKVKRVITGLGVGEHFEAWGYDPAVIIETDWYDETLLDAGFKVTTTPARHFSGRVLSPNKSLWSSFVLETPTIKFFLGGDSGYGKHFAEIGTKHGPFDLVLLECGQYNLSWKYIHMLPEEVVKAAQDLGAKKLTPVHWAKFPLALHAWDEPIIRVTKEAAKKQIPVIHPMIGEKVSLTDNIKSTVWW